MEWTQDRRKSLYILLGFALFLFFFQLGDRPLRNPDEGRYAHITSQMADSGNWLEPKLFGIDYLRKPPLFYWLLALSFKIFGTNEWAARAVPAVFGLAGVFTAYFFSRKFFGSLAAAFTAIFLIVNPWYLHVSRFLVIDAVFSFFVTASFYLFYLAMTEKPRAFVFYMGFYVCVALAFLTKGVLALAFPGIAILIYLLWTRQTVRTLTECHLFLGGLVFLLIAGPWFAWMSLNKPDFWQLFFVREHLARFSAENFEHQEAWYFYPGLMTAFLSPWILFPGAWRFWRERIRVSAPTSPILFLLISGFSGIFFLSLSKSKLATYVLPLLPFFCIALGAAWAKLVEKTPSRLKIFYTFFSLLVLSAYAVIFLMETVNWEYSSKPFAVYAKEKIKSSDPFFIYDHPGPFYDFIFYCKHPVRPIGLEGELEVTRGNSDAQKIALSKSDFQGLLARGDHFYCLMRRSDWHDIPAAIQPKLKILHQDIRKILFEAGAP